MLSSRLGETDSLGGLTETLKVVRMAERHGLSIMPHAANPSMVLLFSMHLMAAIPNAGPYLEYGIEESPWVVGAFSPALDGGHDEYVCIT